MDGGTQVDFFISYNQNDHSWATWIAWTLEAAGYSTILEAWDFRPGNNFALKMHEALTQSDRVIAVLSPTYLTGIYASAEWAAIFAKDPQGMAGRLVPVKVRECEPDGLLKSIIRMDLIGLAEDAAKQELLSGVTAGRVKPLITPTFPGAAAQPVLTERPAAPAPRPEVNWERVLTPVPVVWRSDTAARGSQSALLEVHLIPVPDLPPVEVRAMRQLGDVLTNTARASGLFTQAQAIDVVRTEAAVLAFDGTGSGGPGLLMTRSGQRGGWVPLPRDPLGAILDEADVTTRVLGLLKVLGGLNVVQPDGIAIAIGVEPRDLVMLGNAADIGRRTTASLNLFSRGHARWEPTESVAFKHVHYNAGDISAELAARIVTRFGSS